MNILLAACDFAPISLALMNLKAHALAEPALQRRARIRVVYGSVGEEPEKVVARIVQAAREDQPEIIALSVYVWSRWMMYEASRRLRLLLPETLIVWGGPDVSDEEYSQELLTEHPALDIIVRDEGERTFRSLCLHQLGRGHPLEDIPGITWRDPETRELRVNPKVEFMEDLDEIPTIMEMPEVQEVLPEVDSFALETFRGCYMGCAYCYWGGTRRRAYSMERVFADLEVILAHPNIKKIWFFDSMFGYKKQAAKDILRFIVARRAPDQCVTFFPNLDFIDEELCDLMKAAGVYIEAGIQTTNADAYQYLNRKWDKSFLDRKIPLLEKYGLHAKTQQLILGLPGDHLEGFRGSVDYAFHTQPESIYIFPFSLLPATGYWKRRQEFRVKHEGQYRIVFDSTTFPEDQMVVGGLISAGAKWFDRHSGLAIRLVHLLGIRPSTLFESLGRTFMETHWKLEDSPETRAEVRRRLLVQSFTEEDEAVLDLDLLRAALHRDFPDHGKPAEIEELIRHEAVLNCDEVLDARSVSSEDLEAALEGWQSHPEALPPEVARFDVFDPEQRETGSEGHGPIEYVAHPVSGPRDFFGKDRPRYRVIILGAPGMRPVPSLSAR